MVLQRKIFVLPVAAVVASVILSGCGSHSSSAGSGNFVGMGVKAQAVNQIGVAAVVASPSGLAAGTSMQITVKMNGPAPSGGAVVELVSSDPHAVALPERVRIAPGETTATVDAPISLRKTTQMVGISASYGDTIAGTSIKIPPSTEVNETVLPSAEALTGAAVTSPGAKFQGCWYTMNGNRYQAVRISVANPGTYPFDAVLYRGTTCNTANFADEFGYGTRLQFGGFSYIYAFRDFPNQSNMSAIWRVGTNRSQCVNYMVAPKC